MAKEEEVWYQAKLWLWSNEEQRRESERIPLGPPRRLVTDVVIDIARNLSEASQRYADERYSLKIAGAEIIWPPERATEWIREDKLRAMQPA